MCAERSLCQSWTVYGGCLVRVSCLGPRFHTCLCLALVTSRLLRTEGQSTNGPPPCVALFAPRCRNSTARSGPLNAHHFSGYQTKDAAVSPHHDPIRVIGSHSWHPNPRPFKLGSALPPHSILREELIVQDGTFSTSAIGYHRDGHLHQS